MIKFIKKLNRKQIMMIVPILVFIIIQVYLDLRLPDYMSEMTLALQSGSDKLSDILTPGSKMLLCAFGSFTAAVITGYFVSIIASTYSQNLRSEVFNKVMSYGQEEVKGFSVSSLVVRTTNDITNIQMFIAMGLQVLIKAPILSVSAVTKMADKSITWSLLTGGAVLYLLVVVMIIMFFAIPKTKILQKLTDRINTVARESINGIRVIKAFNAEKYYLDKFDNVNEELTNTNLFIGKVTAIIMPSMQLVMAMLNVGIYLTGAFIISKAIGLDRLDIFSNMIVFSQYAMQVIMSFMMLVMIIIAYPRASVSANRIGEVLDKESNIITGTKKSKSGAGVIEFKDVSFKYSDAEEYTTKNISFKVDSGQTLAIIGQTASGKSSLVNLIPRLYDVTDGEILIDGINVKDYKIGDLNDKLGFVTQKPVIFSGTIKSNIQYGSNKYDAKMGETALKISCAKEFVDSMEGKIDAKIATKGTNISGGQKQRLSIARAVYKNPDIYIFDDSFSALDYKTDKEVRSNLKKNGNKTTIIVAQRIGTILNADQILVLDKGKVAGLGTHKELLKTCELYKEIAQSQLSKEELENA